MKPPASWPGRLLLAWLVLLAASHAVAAWRRGARTDELPPDVVAVELPVVDAGAEALGTVRVAFRDRSPDGAPGSTGEVDPVSTDKPPFLLLHGSPGSRHDFDGLAPLLAAERRTIAVDLPGFGDSGRDVPDLSIDAHARYATLLLDELGIERAHLVGFSMGSGVAIRMTDLVPERVASLTLLSGIGVQEHELFGNHELNHLVHAFQLGAFRAARLLVPHFGALDDAFLGVDYARNFHDSDQRPLRANLLAWDGPALIVHGREDFLVPAAAALEHHRLLPQSELALLDEGHFVLWQRTELVAELVGDLARKADAGTALVRDAAPHARIAAALEPFDPAGVPPAGGVALAILILAIAVATFVSEDLTCIGVGLLVAEGRIGFVPGTLACIAGIFVGDVGVYLEGRWLGRPALARAPLRWLVSPQRVERAERWFERNGTRAVFASRFLPGTRLATYFVAGLVRAPFVRFCLCFLVAAVLWTPVLVGVSTVVGVEVRGLFEAFEEHAFLALAAAALVLLVVQRVVVRALTPRGRRQLLGTWRRWTRWEFWPLWLTYAPVAVYVGWLALRHGGFRAMTAVNPAIPGGGFVGESKSAILAGLGDADDRVARHALLSADEHDDERWRRAQAFLGEIGGAEIGGAFPVVLKPDAGQRGTGVAIVRDAAELERRVRALAVDALVQEYVPGVEFGLFYARHPAEARGRLISITEKKLPFVVGDGARTLEELILWDERAVSIAATYLDLNAGQIDRVPAAGERVAIAELGTHCRGAVFLDGERFLTDALVDAVDRVSKGLPGFHFGRYDVRTASGEALARGEFRVIELNGLTSESTHIYDPRHTLLGGWRTLCRQWRLAFEIGAANRERGAPTSSAFELLGRLSAYRRLERRHALR